MILAWPSCFSRATVVSPHAPPDLAVRSTFMGCQAAPDALFGAANCSPGPLSSFTLYDKIAASYFSSISFTSEWRRVISIMLRVASSDSSVNYRIIVFG